MKLHLKTRLRHARKSWTVWFAAAVPVLLAAAEAGKDHLGSLDEYLSGWGKVAAAMAVSGVVAYLRVRSAAGAQKGE